MPAPSKRGRKRKLTETRVGSLGGPGNETLILAHLSAGDHVREKLEMQREKDDNLNWILNCSFLFNR